MIEFVDKALANVRIRAALRFVFCIVCAFLFLRYGYKNDPTPVDVGWVLTYALGVAGIDISGIMAMQRQGMAIKPDAVQKPTE